MFKLLVLVIFMVYGAHSADRCLTDLHPTLQVKGNCMEISQCNSIGGIYEHNWCMSKSATVKCCFVKEEEPEIVEEIEEEEEIVDIEPDNDQDRCDIDVHPDLKVRGSCMEMSDCESIGGTYLHNWCLSKSASIKCCFRKDDVFDPIENTDETTSVVDYSNVQCNYNGQFIPHSDPTKFYRCSFGWKFLFDCPKGQVWIQEKSWCDFEGPSGWDNLLDIFGSDFFDYDPTEADEDDWAEVIEEVMQETSTAKQDRCDTEEHPQYGKGSCVEKSTCTGVYVDNWCQTKAASVKCCFGSKNWDTICQNGGMHAHEDPSKYIKCLFGKAIVVDCPEGKIYYSDRQACDSEPSGSGLRVSINFLKDPEVEGIKSKAYCLKGFPESGVTIGIGVDLGDKDEAYLRAAGVSESIITKLTPFFKKKDDKACAAVASNPVTLSEPETIELSTKIIQYQSQEIAKKYNMARTSSAKAFDDLTCAQRTVIGSVLYQYGYTNPSKRVPKFWTAVTSNNWPTAILELRNFNDAHPNRRNKEADLLQYDSKTKVCPSNLEDTCKMTTLSCNQRSTCTGKVIYHFCQTKSASTVCCLTSNNGGPVVATTTASPTASSTVQQVRAKMASEAVRAALPKSKSACARFVREAIERGIQKVTGKSVSIPRYHPYSAKDYGYGLSKTGWKTVTPSSYQIGDVVIFDAVPGHVHGHIAIYTEIGWVSDFKQNDIIVSSAYKNGKRQFWRYYG